ncbi:MAG: nucleoside deaminase [Gammaproteobacteria bacterium]
MNKKFLQMAVDIAVENVSTGQGGPYGAVVVKDNRPIASSGNRVTHDLDPTAHAEIMAIRQACRKLTDFQLTGCILYTNCEPCPMCLGAIYWARLDRVYFACDRLVAAEAHFDDCFIYDEIEITPSERSIPMLQLDLPNARQPFQIWADKADKVLY